MASNMGTKRKEESKTKVSYFLSISMSSKSINEKQQQVPKPLVRIKIPRLLMKTVKKKKSKKEHQNQDAAQTNSHKGLIKFDNPKYVFHGKGKVTTSLSSTAISSVKSKLSSSSSSSNFVNNSHKDKWYKSSIVFKRLKIIGKGMKQASLSGNQLQEKIETKGDSVDNIGSHFSGDTELCKKRILMGERCRRTGNVAS